MQSPIINPTHNHTPDPNIEHITKPSVFGPGAWFVDHTLAKRAIDEQKEDIFINEHYVIISNLPCMTCRKEALAYYQANDIHKYKGMVNEFGVRTGMFRYTWTFHNHVNTRLGKKTIDFNTAYNMYGMKESEICQIDCDEPKPNAQVNYTLVPPPTVSIVPLSEPKQAPIQQITVPVNIPKDRRMINRRYNGKRPNNTPLYHRTINSTSGTNINGTHNYKITPISITNKQRNLKIITTV